VVGWCAFFCFSASTWAQVKFVQLTSPIQSWSNYALSSNGKVMRPISGERFFAGRLLEGSSIWDWVKHSTPPSESPRTAIRRTGADGNSNPARWQHAMGWVDLGHPAEDCVLDGSWGDAWGVNADGSIVVGLTWYCPGADGFQWTKQGASLAWDIRPMPAAARPRFPADGSTMVGFY
jgi:hypothetical protein